MTSHAEHMAHLDAVICAGRERPCTLAAGHIGPHIDRPAPWLDAEVESTPSIDADYPPAPVVDSPLFPDRLTLVDWSMIQLALEQRAQRFADIGVPETSILYTKLAGRVRRGVR